MNNFQGIQSGAGLLKQVYNGPSKTPTEEALRRRLKRSSDKILVQTKEEIESGE